MTRGKMIDDNTLQGDAGVALIHRRVSQMKHIWYERHIDPRIDGIIGLRDLDTGEMSNQHIFVQSKTTRDKFPGEDDTRFHFPCDERDIDYRMKAGHNPVILVSRGLYEGPALLNPLCPERPRRGARHGRPYQLGATASPC